MKEAEGFREQSWEAGTGSGMCYNGYHRSGCSWSNTSYSGDHNREGM